MASRTEGLTPLLDLIDPELLDLDLDTIVLLLAAHIIEHRDEARVALARGHGATMIEFLLEKSDRPKLLGREGNVIKALKTIVNAILGPRVQSHRFRVDLVPDRISQRRPSRRD